MKQDKSTIILASLLVIIAAISRVVMYPDNFSPIIGMAIFAGAVFTDKRLAFVLPVVAMLLSDVMFEAFNITTGFWGWGQLVGYGILVLITFIAFSMKKHKPGYILAFSVGSSLIFFILSNLSFFLIDNRIYQLYTQDAQGLMNCYVAALPFLKTGIIADLVYSFVLFGSFHLLRNYLPAAKATAA